MKQQPSEKVAARLASAGISAGAVRGRVGDPADPSVSQRVALLAEQLGFGGSRDKDYGREFRARAAKKLKDAEIANPESPNYGNRNFKPNSADVEAEAHSMAMRRVESIDDPEYRDLFGRIVDAEFNIQRSGKAEVFRPGQEETRPGLRGEATEGKTLKEQEYRIKQLSAEARAKRPGEIMERGITDESIKDIGEQIKKAYDDGNIEEANRLTALYDQMVDTKLVVEGELSAYEPTRTQSGDAARNLNKLQRREIYGDESPRTAGSETEGKVSGPGARSRESYSSGVFEALAADIDAEGNFGPTISKFFERYNPKDVQALKERLKKISSDRSGDSFVMTAAEKLRAFEKALSIEGQAKAASVSGVANRPAAQRRFERETAPTMQSPAEIEETRAAGRRSASQAVKLIDQIMSGERGYANPSARGAQAGATSAGRKQMSSDRKILFSAFKSMIDNRKALKRVNAALRGAMGEAAAGNTARLGSIKKALQYAIRESREPTRAGAEVSKFKGSFSQLAAIMGTEGKHSPSTRAMRGGINRLTGRGMKGIKSSPATQIAETPKSGRMIDAEEYSGQVPAAPTAGFRSRSHMEAVARRERDAARRGSQGLDETKSAVRAFKDVRGALVSTAMSPRGKGGDVARMASSRDPRVMAATRAELNKEIKALTNEHRTAMEQLGKGKMRGPGGSKINPEQFLTNQLDEAKAKLEQLKQEQADFNAMMQGGKGKQLPAKRYAKVKKRMPGTLEDPGPVVEYVDRQTAADYQKALEARIKILEGEVDSIEQAVERAARGVNVARETKTDVAFRIKQALSKRPPAYKPKMRKKERIKEGASTIPESLVPRKGGIPEESRRPREVTGGQYIGGVKVEPGRPRSDVRERAARFKGKKRVPSKPKYDSTRTREIRKKRTESTSAKQLINKLPSFRGRDVAGLLEGLPA